MPDDLAISAAHSAPALATNPKPVATAVKDDPSSDNPAPFPNPVSHLDAALGIEVMQFVDNAGGITQSFPTQRQLASYTAGIGEPANAANPVP